MTALDSIERDAQAYDERWGDNEPLSYDADGNLVPLSAALVSLRPTLQSLDLTALGMVTPSPKVFAIEQLAPLGEVTLFTGPGSAGKSLLGQQLATAAAAGLSCLGLHVMAGPAIYLTCEDDADQLAEHADEKHHDE